MSENMNFGMQNPLKIDYISSLSQITGYNLAMASAKDHGSHHSYKSDRPTSLIPGVS